MALVVVATPGELDSNSYATVAEGDTYFEGRVGATAWTGATPEERAAALVMATNRLDEELYVGIKTWPDQRLKWPRVEVYDEDGDPLPEEEVPRLVKEAAFEEALYILANKTVDVFAPTGLEKFSRLKSGDTDITLRDDSTTGASGSGLPGPVLRKLRVVLVTYEVPEMPTTFRITRA